MKRRLTPDRAIAFVSVALIVLSITGCNPTSSDNSARAGSIVTPATTSADLTLPADTIAAYRPILAGHDKIIKAISETGARAVVVNFWATWCAPCIEEFPLFLEFREKYREEGLEVVFVTVDFEDERDKAAAFLYEHSVNWPSFMATGDANEFITAFHPDWSGSVPTSFIYSGNGEFLGMHEGKMSYEDLADFTEPYLTD